jgi:hypothetical protein
MKKLGFTAVLVVFLLFLFNGIQGQTTQLQLDQVQLMKQYLGTWQLVVNKDTTELLEFTQNGNIFTNNVYYMIKGKKSHFNVQVYCYSPVEKKFYGFVAMQNGMYSTSIGSFVTDKKEVFDMVQNFNPDQLVWKYEINFESSNSMTLTDLTPTGVKASEYKLTKLK